MSSTDQSQDSKPALFDKAKNFFAARTAESCCSYFLDKVRPDSQILDVGCGPGSITVDLAQLCPQGHVTGIDISSEGIQHAKNLSASRGVSNVKFIQGDARDLSSQFPDTKFDIVHAHMFVMHLADPVAVIKQMRALLKPGGLLATRDTIRHVVHPAQAGPDSSMEISRKLLAQHGGHPEGGSENHAWVHEAGFPWENIKHGVVTWELAAQDKPLFVQTVRDTFGMFARALNSERSPETVIEEWKDWWAKWEKDEGARFMALEGWVIASA